MKKLYRMIKTPSIEMELTDDEFDPKIWERIEIEEEDDTDLSDTVIEAIRKAVGDKDEEILKVITDLKNSRGERPKQKYVETDGPEIQRTMYGDDAAAFGTRLRAVPGFERRMLATMTPHQLEIYPPEAAFHCAEWLRHVVQKGGVNKAGVERFNLEQADREFELGLRAERANQSTSSGEGLEIMPQPLSNYLIEQRDAVENLAPHCQQFTSLSLTLDVPAENAVGAVATHAEGSAMSATDSTFTQVQLTKIKKGRVARLSSELVSDQDGAFSMVEIISRQTMRGLGVEWDDEVATGTGFTSDLEDAFASDIANSAAFTIANLFALYFGLPRAWRQGGGGLFFMANDATAGILSGLEDGAGASIFDLTGSSVTGLSDDGNQNPTLLNIPFLTAEFTEARLALVRMREAYGILRDPGGGLRIDLDASRFFLEDQIGLRILERRGGAVLTASAMKSTATAITSVA